MIREIIFSTIGGLGLFLFGMRLMSDGLKSVSAEKLKRFLTLLTNNKYIAIALGAGFTALIQSSSAMTVMVVGLVNSGLMTLGQAISVVLGANIGTTFTAWLVSALAIFKLSQYAFPALGIGFIMNAFGKRRKIKNWGLALFGFGMIFLGLSIMKDAFGPLGDSQLIKDFLMNFSHNPLLGVLVGALVTILLQSSSVTIAIIQIMAFQGLLSFESAIPLVLGDNIGTTITAELAAIKGNINAKRTARAHTAFNIIGVIYMLPLVWTGAYPKFVEWIVPGGITQKTIMVNIAMSHTIFNVVNNLVFLPLTGFLEKVAKLMAPGRGLAIEEAAGKLDRNLLKTPQVALVETRREILRMAEMAREAVRIPMDGLFSRDSKLLDEVPKLEDAIDDLQREITRYVVDLSRENLAPAVADEIPVWLHSVNDIEKVGDHAENLGDLTDRVLDEKVKFSEAGSGEIKMMYEAVGRMLSLIIDSLSNMDRQKAAEVLEIEKRVNDLHIMARESNLRRLNEGRCEPGAGIIFLDYIMNLEKIGDHLSNVAIAIKREFHYDGEGA